MELSFNKIIIEAYKNADITMVIYNQGAIPQNLAQTFDGPPTLERSGSEHRVGVVKTIEEDRDERWSLP